jgi:undecaprenyl-diphosphatase
MESMKQVRTVEKQTVKQRFIGLRPDFGLVVVLLVFTLLGAGVWGFAVLAEEVLEGETSSFDEHVLLLMRNPSDHADPLGPFWMEEMGRDFTALGGIAILTGLTLSVTGYLLLIHKPRIALTLVLAVVSGILVSSLLKQGFDRPRPDLVPHGSHVQTSSFPSGHSMMSAVCYLTLATLLASVQQSKRVKSYLVSLAILITLLVGISRVYMGVHWPTDVLGGWLAGSAWAMVTWLLSRWFQNLGAQATEEHSMPPDTGRKSNS